MASSGDEQSDKECPLCMEPLELDDLNFYPCKCEYQICRFCWHRIRTDENGLCPACRQAYPEDPVNFKPLSAEELQRIKSEKKQKQQQHKQKVSESRKHLANLRVLQEDLVYVVGLSPRIADAETLKKSEYFGKYGRIKKVVVGAANTAQSSNCTAYVTYYRAEDALKAIQSVNNVSFDGRTVKASLGTTKYCSSYLRNQPCHKPDCMYLHDVAKEEASFTKEDMHAGRHTEYEKRLHDLMASQIQQQRRADSSSSSPKDSGYFDQQLCINEVPDELTEACSNRQSRQHNPPPRHRARLGNRENSKSSERGQSQENMGEASVSNPSPAFGSSCQMDQLQRPGMEQQTEEKFGMIPMQRQQMPPDWPGRLLAAMQAQVNNQSLFSQDETVFARQAQAKAQAGGNLRHSEDHSLQNHQHNQPVNSEGLVQTVDRITGQSNEEKSFTKQTLEEENGQTRPVLSVQQNHSFLNGVPDAGQQRIPARNGPESILLSGDALEVRTQTDWLAAFGLKNNLATSSGKPVQPLHQIQQSEQQQPAPSKQNHQDDDLGFDPFWVSSQGLANLLEEEQAEKEKAAIRGQQEIQRQQSLQFSQVNTQSNMFPNNSFTPEWNGGQGTYFPQQHQLSPNSALVAGYQKQNSVPNEAMMRPGVTGSSPIPHQFTTPPPGFPPGMECPNGGAKMFQNGPMFPGFNGVRQTAGRHFQVHSQGGMSAGPPPPKFLQGFLPGGAREPSPTHPLPPRGPARSVSPHGDAFNLKEWQEGLKNLLPGVPIKFAPGLGGGNGAPPNGNPNWMGNRPPQPMGHPFTQPPPPLQVSTNGPMGPPPMRHSPPGGDPYCMPPPPLGPPRPGPGGIPPVYQAGSPWASLTPPPPGYSPRQQSL